METKKLTENAAFTAQQLIDLCVIVYNDDLSKIPPAVKAIGLEMAWGPEQAEGLFDIPYSALFVAKNSASNDYVVVIRGTQFDSLWSWLFEDFDIGHTVPLSRLIPSAPHGAHISAATDNGMKALLSLKDKKQHSHLMDFLTQQSMASVTVTGHSLGGTLTFPMAAYIKDRLENIPVTCSSFAGLTPGNAACAHYLDTVLPAPSVRYVNPYDVAPNFFDSQSNVTNIYVPTYPWDNLDIILRGIIDHLFNRAAGKHYTQPSGFALLPGTIHPPQGSWKDEAEYQHHSTTYQTLVGQI